MDAFFLLSKPRPKYVNRPFKRLPLKQRAIFILYLAGFTYQDIQRVVKSVVSHSTISNAISMGKEEYGD